MYIVHDVPGRLRIKLEKLKNNPHRLEKVKHMLSTEGVHRVKANALTGSIVIEYDQLSVRPQTFIGILTDNGYKLDEVNRHNRSVETHEKIAVTIGKATFSFLAGKVLEANGMPYIAAFI